MLQKQSPDQQSCSMEEGVLKNFAKFTGKHLCQSLFFNKVAGHTPATSSVSPLVAGADAA